MGNEILKGVRDVFIEEDCMWMITDNFNCLFKYTFSEQKLDLIISFPETIGTNNFAFNRIVKIQNEIYLFPLTAKGIFCLDLQKREFIRLNISIDNFNEVNNTQVVVVDEYIYCLKRFPDVLIKIHLATKKVDIFYAGNEQYINKAVESLVNRNYSAPCLFQGKIVWFHYNNVFTFFDLEKESFVTERLENVLHETVERTKAFYQEGLEDWIIGARVFQDVLWLFSYDGRVYQYDDKSHKIQSVQINNDKNTNTNEGELVRSIFMDLVPLEDELWFIPQYESRCIKYDSNTGQCEECLDEYKKKWNENQTVYSLCKAIHNKKILLYSYCESCFCILDTMNNTVDKKIIKIPFGRFSEESLTFRSMMIKNNFYGFDDLSFFLKDTVCNNKKMEVLDDSVGGKIYEVLRQSKKQRFGRIE